MAKQKATSVRATRTNSVGGIEAYFRKIFGLMFGAVALTAVAAYLTIWGGGFVYLINMQTGGFTGLYYILLFGGVALSIWTQVRVFKMQSQTATLLLALYAILIGVVMTPLIVFSLSVNPAAILYAFIVAAVMFGCMAMFGYKTVKDLSFLGIFLFMGMIGLILVGLASMIWPLGSGFATVVSLIGVLIFALFTAYDMQNLKNAYAVLGGNETMKNQLAVSGALHLYISFVAMFQYLLSLFSRN